MSPEEPQNNSHIAHDSQLNADTPSITAESSLPTASSEISTVDSSISASTNSLATSTTSVLPKITPETTLSSQVPNEDQWSFFSEKASPIQPSATANDEVLNTDVPQSLSFSQSHPIIAVAPSMPITLSGRLFNILAYAPWLFLTLLLISQTIFTLDVRALWFSDEIRHAAAFTSMLENGKWFVLEMNGQLYPDKPPLYFLFLRSLYAFMHTNEPILYFTAAALSGLLYLWATLILGRVVRLDGRTLLAGGIMLMCTGYVMGVIHYARMDLLFSSAIIVSYAMFFIAWSKPRSFVFTLLGFFFAAIACLIKGPLGIIFPLLTSVVFLFWKGTPKRILKADVFLGCILAIAIIGIWVVGVVFETKDIGFLFDEIIKKQILQRATNTFHHKEGATYYITRLPLMLLPWILVVFCLPWHTIFSKKLRTAIAASRTPQKEGLAYLWCIALSTIVLLSVLSGKILIYYLPALPALILLGGRAVLQLSGKRAVFFRSLLIFFFAFAALATVVASLVLFDLIDLPFAVKGIPKWDLIMHPVFFLIAALFFIIAFALLLLLHSSAPEGLLILLALGSVVISYPLFAKAAPSLSSVMSPKKQAFIMKKFIADGYTPVTVKVYGGTYTYYAQHPIVELSSLNELEQLMATKEKVIVAMRLSRWNEWQSKPACLSEVNRQWIETKEYVLLACPQSEQKNSTPLFPEHDSNEILQPAIIEENTAPAEHNEVSPENDTVLELPSNQDIQLAPSHTEEAVPNLPSATPLGPPPSIPGSEIERDEGNPIPIEDELNKNIGLPTP